MSRSSEGEKPIDEISVLHESLVHLIGNITMVEHMGSIDVATYSWPFLEVSKNGAKRNLLAIGIQFPCSGNHQSVRIPQDSVVHLGFLSDPLHLTIGNHDANLTDSSENVFKSADCQILNYYARCVRAAITEPPDLTQLTPFSDS